MRRAHDPRSASQQYRLDRSQAPQEEAQGPSRPVPQTRTDPVHLQALIEQATEIQFLIQRSTAQLAELQAEIKRING